VQHKLALHDEAAEGVDVVGKHLCKVVTEVYVWYRTIIKGGG
jgi:hypothetical protein